MMPICAALAYSLESSEFACELPWLAEAFERSRALGSELRPCLGAAVFC